MSCNVAPHLALILRLSRAAAAAAVAPEESEGLSPASGPWVCASSGVSVELPLVAPLPAEVPSSSLPVFSEHCARTRKIIQHRPRRVAGTQIAEGDFAARSACRPSPSPINTG